MRSYLAEFKHAQILWRQPNKRMSNAFTWFVVSYFITDIPLIQHIQPATRVRCNIAFGDLVVNFPNPGVSKSIEIIVALLINILRDTPYVDFDRSLAWTGMVSAYAANIEPH